MAKQQGNRRTFKELCADYVLNILDQDERMRFEEMLDEATEEERELYQQMRTKGNELLFSEKDDPSPDELREQLLSEVEDGNEQETDRSSEQMEVASDEKVVDETDDNGETYVSLTLVTSIVLGFICLSLVFYAFSLRSEISTQESTITDQEEEIADLENEMNELQQMLAVIDSRQLHLVRLLGMEANPFGYGNVIWDSQNNRAVVRLAELPSPEEDEQYQLWAIFDNKAVNISSFSVDGNGDALFMTENLDGLDRQKDFSFAVTLETDGESSQLNGEMHLMGSFSGQ
ncbi:anti-sigma factor domain-containing protein [Fodinibius sp.]|uniref:anti-sigma factor domain-containing protein n=1 Tax=Fodinibius sp. TaxID=1872440 RepID=UPI002ACDD6E3|nr:anti-sigma factor [Fodinibius sp.]MDZ7658417.1 anti-sigma factor [Fodinibius sp.]